jgi:hypothetical protein
MYLEQAIQKKLIFCTLEEFKPLLMSMFSYFLERNYSHEMIGNDEINIEFFFIFIEKLTYFKAYLNESDFLKISKKLFYMTRDVLIKRNEMKYLVENLNQNKLLFLIHLIDGSESLPELKIFFHNWFLTVFSHIKQKEYKSFFDKAKKQILKVGLIESFSWENFNDWKSDFEKNPEQELELFFLYSDSKLDFLVKEILHYMNDKEFFIRRPSKEKINFLFTVFDLDSMSFSSLVSLIQKIAKLDFNEKAFLGCETDFFDLWKNLLKKRLSCLYFRTSLHKTAISLRKKIVVKSLLSLKKKIHPSSSIHISFEGNELLIEQSTLTQEEKQNNEDIDDLIFSFDDLI